MDGAYQLTGVSAYNLIGICSLWYKFKGVSTYNMIMYIQQAGLEYIVTNMV